MAKPELDVLICGGGAAGLWTLDVLRRAGWSAALAESRALGAGQTIQSQGIIHGGGKYALRGVRDLEAVKAIRDMPGHWRECFAGKRQPDLSEARLASEECLLWLPRGTMLGNLKRKGAMSVVVGAGLLATKPVEIKTSAWPAVLAKSALRVYSMAEPVVETPSLLAALAAPHRAAIFKSAGGLPKIAARLTVLAAGAGNEALLAEAGATGVAMQRRPLLMALLRGKSLPRLFAHCVDGGKTRLTITTTGDVWQIGGEFAEKFAGSRDLAAARAAAAADLRAFLPDLDLRNLEIATYEAVRAEAKDPRSKRPSGVHVQEAKPGVLVAWPTKLALAPVLAEEVKSHVERTLGRPGGYNPPLPAGPPVEIARPPWEEAAWFPVS